MSERPTHDVAGAATRMIRATGARVANGRPDDLRLIAGFYRDTDRALLEAVAGLRAAGHTDGEIGRSLGVSRQAISKRWPDGGRRVGAAARYPPERH